MGKTLEDFYYGNITPCKRQMVLGSGLKRMADRVICCENLFSEQLDEIERTRLATLVRSQHS